ncbi:alternative oxidase-domain-containing protein [Pavlovales sp. CCMP2436]|nr:alternative oxidase-domain-containing protein [Pavlovales sp. CCMP2436]
MWPALTALALGLARPSLHQPAARTSRLSAATRSPAEQSVLGDFEMGLDRALVGTVKGAIDVLYRERDIPRFYVLETIARVPYFAFASCLHLSETLGRRDASEFIKLHCAQADNELQHLLIMEALGGSESFFDRFMAQHIAVFYFVFVSALYWLKPQQAYHLSELIEEHAYATYDGYLATNEAWLRAQPAPQVAISYYAKRGVDASGRGGKQLTNLWETFVEVRDDEAEHWQTNLCMASAPTDSVTECLVPES